MMGAILGWVLMATAQDAPPLAGTLPPMPPPRSAPERREDRVRGRLFISPMGEPFRGSDPVKQWFDRADADRDGALTANEFVADAMRFFVVLDRGKDGEIDPDDVAYYETVLAPEIRTGGEAATDDTGPRGDARRRGGRRGRGMGGRGGEPGGFSFGGGDVAGPRKYSDTRRGAARFSFFDYPEPVVVADANFNRGVDPTEFRDAALDRFAALDKNHDGHISRGELPSLPERFEGGPTRRGGSSNGPPARPDSGRDQDR